MLGTAKQVYQATRKKHDLIFNVYFMRPIAAAVVGVFADTKVTPNQITILNLFIFLVSIALLIVLPSYAGGLIAIGVLELSYCFDCVDGMLARYKKIASKEGHLFDFFTDELKAVLLAGALPLRFYASGGFGITGETWAPGTAAFLIAGIASVVILASAISLTNFVRRPELSGRESTVEAHYETVDHTAPKSLVGRVGHLVTTFLRFLNHYPSHIWLFAIFGRLDVMFWIYVAINFLYLGRGWLGILLRFGRSPKERA